MATAPTLAFLNPGNGDFSRARPLRIPAVPGYGVVLDYLVTDIAGDRTLWILRTTGGGHGYYDGVGIQAVRFPSMESDLRFASRNVRWVTNIVAWEQDGTTYVGADHTRSGVEVAVD